MHRFFFCDFIRKSEKTTALPWKSIFSTWRCKCIKIMPPTAWWKSPPLRKPLKGGSYCSAFSGSQKRSAKNRNSHFEGSAVVSDDGRLFLFFPFFPFFFLFEASLNKRNSSFRPYQARKRRRFSPCRLATFRAQLSPQQKHTFGGTLKIRYVFSEIHDRDTRKTLWFLCFLL